MAEEIDADALALLFEGAFAQVFRGEVESDDFNRLVLRAGLAAEDIVVLRAYAKYCKQIGFALSQATIEATLAAHPHIARMLVRVFRLRFHPAEHDDAAADAQVHAIEQALERVANLSEDRVLRQLLALIARHLAHQPLAHRRRPFGRARRAPQLPELQVRFGQGAGAAGAQAAGGDLRLFTALRRHPPARRQGGARRVALERPGGRLPHRSARPGQGADGEEHGHRAGGFERRLRAEKAPPASDREAFMKEGVACYQDYLRALLDLTDNHVAGKVVPPPLVRRLDGDDPYLVVAADKGTATFSDYANAVSAEYGHWLGDAFASGGSVGYDHKAMGITARGAWESVKRHFRELGSTRRARTFTVVGIGDMSGDVFGNGMLLSRHIRLVAAFDHRHVFIDPDPDAARSFAERERLFKLPRSSWADYDTSLISAGGGVWSRSQKSIPLSPQACAALGIDGRAARHPPNCSARY